MPTTPRFVHLGHQERGGIGGCELKHVVLVDVTVSRGRTYAGEISRCRGDQPDQQRRPRIGAGVAPTPVVGGGRAPFLAINYRS